jgi:hypothetical protein
MGSVNEPPPYYARSIAISFRSEMAEQVTELYRATSLPMVANEPGLVVVLGLIDPAAGQACSISVWETAADRERAGIIAPGAGPNLESYAALLTGPYVREMYDVTACVLPAPEHRGQFTVARMTTVELHSSRWDDGVAALRAAIESRRAAAEENFGGLLLENAGRRRAIIVEVAASESTLHLTGRLVRDVARDLWRGDILTRHPETQVYQVMATP